MSSTATFDGGEITITPPLNHGEIRKAEQAIYEVIKASYLGRRFEKHHTTPAEAVRDHATLSFEVQTFQRETDEGVVNGREAVGLTTGDWLSGHLTMGEQINLIADACPGHVFNGVIGVVENSVLPSKVVAQNVESGGPRAKDVKGTMLIEWEDGTTTSADAFED